MPSRLVVLGATGDLTARYLLPALGQLVDLGLLEESFELVGVAKDTLDTDSFREFVAAKLRDHGKGLPDPVMASLSRQSIFVSGDVTDDHVLQQAMDTPTAAQDRPVAVYLALPHGLFEPVIEALGRCRLPAGFRVVVEKPFGEDLAGAVQLNGALARVTGEDRIFRVDHFLAKQTILNLLGLRFANRLLEPVWNRSHVASVDIVFDETVDAQSRASYYDRSGALRDMIQNHLLQILAFVAMEPPLSITPLDVSSRKVDVLRAVRALTPDEVDQHTTRGRYTSGEVQGRDGKQRRVDSYTDAPGVEPSRETETFVDLTLFVDNWRWAGVPFRLRTGKALQRDRREIVVRFAPVPHQAFADQPLRSNELRLQMDPDRMALQLNINGPGDPFDLECAVLDANLAMQKPTPYGQLLLAILAGDTRLSAHAAEAEEGWRIVEPVLAAWRDGGSPLVEYAAGSDGPVPSVIPQPRVDLRPESAAEEAADAGQQATANA